MRILYFLSFLFSYIRFFFFLNQFDFLSIDIIRYNNNDNINKHCTRPAHVLKYIEKKKTLIFSFINYIHLYTIDARALATIAVINNIV